MTRVVAILQARLSSSRLPGKVLRLVQGRPLLSLQLERVRRAKRIDQLVVATSTDPSDDALAAFCQAQGIACFRGSLDDVLDRFHLAATAHAPTHVVRLTGDCPLADPDVIDGIVGQCLAGGYDLVTNTLRPTFPDGLDCWCMRFTALQRAAQEATRPSHREHVTLYLMEPDHGFTIGSFDRATDLSHLRWTVDEADDLALIDTIYGELYPANHAFTTADVLALLDRRPELATRNTRHLRDEGLQKSLAKDRAIGGASKSLAMVERAKARIPGGTMLLSKRPDQFAPGAWPGYYRKAKGVEVYDLDHRRYIDMSIGGIGATVLGYAHDEVDAAVHQAIAGGVASSLNCAEEIDLADELCRLHPWADQARFTRAGGEAMAVAIRACRAATGRDRIAFCGYHGWHDWYLAANVDGDRLGGHLLTGLNPAGVPKALAGTALPFRYNQLDELTAIVAAHGPGLAAVVMEPLRNFTPAAGFLEGVRAVCDRLGIPLIFDEISAGFRISVGGAHRTLAVQPDLAVFSKALGNGYAIGAVIGKRAIMQAAGETFISSTCWTERIGPTAALAMLRVFERDQVHQHLVRIGERIQRGWAEVGKRHGFPLEIGGLAPLSHYTFERPDHLSCKAFVVRRMLDRGFLASNLFYSMAAHRDHHVDAYLDALDAVFGELASTIHAGTLDEAIEGRPAVAGFKRLA